MNGLIEQWIDWLPSLVDGLGVSVQLAVVSLLIGLPLGLAEALLVASPNRIVRWITLAVVEFGRGTPTLVLLYLIYYGLPSQGLVLPAFGSAVVALSFMTGAYTSEIIRASLQAVPRGLVEAAAALGINRWGTFRFILFPEGIRIAIPALMGFAIQLFQTTSLVFLITLPELLSRAYSIGSTTFQYTSVLALAGVLYLLVTLPSGWLAALLEKRMGRHLA